MSVQKARTAALGILVSMLLGMGSVCFGGQTSNEQTTLKEVKKEVADAAQAVKRYSVDQRDEAVTKVKTVLNDLDTRIEALEARIDSEWDSMNKAGREKARTTLKALREQRNEVAEWYGGLKHSSSDAWELMKKGFSDAYAGLVHKWEKAEEEFDATQ